MRRTDAEELRACQVAVRDMSLLLIEVMERIPEDPEFDKLVEDKALRILADLKGE